jgi:glycerol-3-phosphate dehydrogenase
MVCTLADFFVRRTGLVYFDVARVRQWKHVVAERCAVLLQWPAGRVAEELRIVEECIMHASNFV